MCPSEVCLEDEDELDANQELRPEMEPFAAWLILVMLGTRTMSSCVL